MCLEVRVACQRQARPPCVATGKYNLQTLHVFSPNSLAPYPPEELLAKVQVERLLLRSKILQLCAVSDY